jgi:hypothetical protein
MDKKMTVELMEYVVWIIEIAAMEFSVQKGVVA